MKRISIFVCLLMSLMLLVTSCKTRPTGGASSLKIWQDIDDYNLGMLIDLERDLSQYQRDVEQALVLRTKAMKFYHLMRDKKISEEHLTSRDLQRLSQGLADYLKLREKILGLVSKFRVWDDDNVDPKLDKYVRLKGVMLAVSAGLILYDNYNAVVILYQNDSKLRKKLNEADPAYGINEDAFYKLAKSFHSSVNREAMEKALKRLKKHKKWIRKSGKEDETLAYLDSLIRLSPSYAVFKDRGRFDKLSERLMRDVAFLQKGRDILRSMKNDTINEISKIFGNTVGLVETRKGKMYNKPEITKEIAAQLKPLDILLEKTPFRLTDKFIPGHFGHVAIWLGTEAELRKAGMWKKLSPYYQKQIQSGHSVLEALREGVVLNTLDHFLNVDDFAALRPNNLTWDQQQEALKLSIGQLGKEYDFNFDVETQDKIVCSELAYVCFPTMSWPVENKVGRTTISPDNVAAKALPGGPLDLIIFWHKGELVPAEEDDKLYKDLYEAGLGKTNNSTEEESGWFSF